MAINKAMPFFLVLLKSNKSTPRIIKNIPPSPKKETTLKKGVKKPPAFKARLYIKLKTLASKEKKELSNHCAIKSPFNRIMC